MQEVEIRVKNLRSGDIIRLDKGDVSQVTVVSVVRLPGGGYRLYADSKANTRRIIEYSENGMVWLVSAKLRRGTEF